VQELNEGEQWFAEMIQTILNDATEKKEDEKTAVSKLLAHLVSKKLVTTADAAKGFDLCLEVLDDAVIDIPTLPSFLGKSLASLVAAGFSLASLVEIPSLAAQEHGLDVVAILLLSLTQTLGEQEVKTLVEKAGGVSSFAPKSSPEWLQKKVYFLFFPFFFLESVLIFAFIFLLLLLPRVLVTCPLPKKTTTKNKIKLKRKNTIRLKKKTNKKKKEFFSFSLFRFFFLFFFKRARSWICLP